MTFGTFAKRQLWFEPTINASNDVGDYKSSIGGILKNIRIRYIITENFTDDFQMSLKLVDINDNSIIIAESNFLTLNDFTKPNSLFDFHQGWIRFDFSQNKILSKDNIYKLKLDYICSNYNTTNNRFIMFAIDYPFRTYETNGSDDPTINGYADVQFYIERRYDEFIER